jgi:hypothetical protein
MPVTPKSSVGSSRARVAALVASCNSRPCRPKSDGRRRYGHRQAQVVRVPLRVPAARVGNVAPAGRGNDSGERGERQDERARHAALDATAARLVKDDARDTADPWLPSPRNRPSRVPVASERWAAAPDGGRSMGATAASDGGDAWRACWPPPCTGRHAAGSISVAGCVALTAANRRRGFSLGSRRLGLAARTGRGRDRGGPATIGFNPAGLTRLWRAARPRGHVLQLGRRLRGHWLDRRSALRSRPPDRAARGDDPSAGLARARDCRGRSAVGGFGLGPRRSASGRATTAIGSGATMRSSRT